MKRLFLLTILSACGQMQADDCQVTPWRKAFCSPHHQITYVTDGGASDGENVDGTDDAIGTD